MPIYDQFGRMMEAAPARPDTGELYLANVRDRYSSYPGSGLTAARLTAILRAADGGDMTDQAELFEDMEAEPHLGGMFGTRKLAVAGLSWEIQPGDEEDAAGVRAAEFAVQTFDALPQWENNFLDILDSISKGYSVHDIKWDVSTGQAVFRDLEYIHPKNISWRDSLTPRVLTGENRDVAVDPPPFRLLWHQYKARSGWPQRQGLLRTVAWIYLLKKYALVDWATFIELFAMPVRVGEYPPGATAEEKTALMNAVKSLGADASAVISSATKINFVEAQKYGSTSGYQAFLEWLDSQQAYAILGQVGTSQATSTGLGSSIGDAQADVRHDLIESDAKAIENTINRQLLTPLTLFNFGAGVKAPKYKLHYEPAEDKQVEAATLKTLVEIGFRPSQEYVSERFDVPLPQAGETPLAGPAPAPATATAKNTARGATAAAAGEGFVEAALPELADAGALEAALAPVLALVDSGASFAEIKEKLPGLYPKMDTAGIEQALAQTMFVARLRGIAEGIE